jgi:EAL domain-containing protein (putative c-di-GMP-specific phosphodiesterase class I)
VLAITDIEGLIYGFIIETEADSFMTVGLMVLVSQLLAFFGAHNFVIFDFIPSIDMLPTLDTVPMLFSVRGYYLQFALVGGSGATLGLLLALLLFNGGWLKGRRMARASLFPMLFNINEPLLYGFPVMLNPFYLIPFITAPLASAAISYLAFWLRLVPPITMMVDWTVPPILSGYLSTGSLSASVLQAACIVVSVALYYPFVRAHRSYEQAQRRQRFAAMQDAAYSAAKEEEPPVVYRDDSIGELAREFAGHLAAAARQGQLPFTLAYQPKTDRNGRVVGSEALLRWSDAEMGQISPITAVELMEESGLSSVLGRWVIERAISEFTQIRQGHLTNLRISINLDPRHLRSDDTLVGFIAELRDRYVILPGEVEFEITEHVAVQATEAMKDLFKQLRELGFGLTIDDLGMGYSSLNYISEYGVQTVKVDASLVSQVASDHNQQGIVSSIVQLARSLKLELVVEGVEAIEQVEALSALGVEVFQGFYFSRPLTLADFKEYFAEHQ